MAAPRSAAAYGAEAVVGLAGLLGFHPLRSLVGLAIAIAVILLIATDVPARSPL